MRLPARAVKEIRKIISSIYFFTNFCVPSLRELCVKYKKRNITKTTCEASVVVVITGVASSVIILINRTDRSDTTYGTYYSAGIASFGSAHPVDDARSMRGSVPLPIVPSAKIHVG